MLLTVGGDSVGRSMLLKMMMIGIEGGRVLLLREILEVVWQVLLLARRVGQMVLAHRC